MKAYQLIFNLIKHPFSDVRIFGQYIITGVRHNNYDNHYTLDSIADDKKD